MVYEVHLGGAIGDGLITPETFDEYLEMASAAVKTISAHREEGRYAHLTLPHETADLAEIEAVASTMRAQWTDLVVFGTGGSSLGGQALLGLTHPKLPGPKDRPRIYFLDNLDGELMAAALDRIDLRKCGFLTISKSGSTPETVAQMQAAMSRIIELGAEKYLDQHFVVLVGAGDNPLRTIATEMGLQVIEHAENLGGRFSVLANVGLIPAAVAGLDIRALRQGAKETLDAFLTTTEVRNNVPAAGAALSVAAAEVAGKNINVMFAYSERLRDFGRWFQQLWSESLGKNGKGSTPVFAAGPVDQHSQLQLYADGPKDKLFTFITYPTEGEGPLLEGALLQDKRVGYLRDHFIGDVVAAEAAATMATLRAQGHPVREFRLNGLNEQSLGALLMHFMLETEVAAHILGVDAYGQPGVEAGKLRTKEILLP